MQQLRVRRSSNGDGARSAQRRSVKEAVEVGEDREEDGRLFVWLLAFRALVSLATSRAAFAPDEHWQSLEVAHRIAFGYGYQTWEWRDNRTAASAWSDGPIRTVLYPALFVPVYVVLKWTALDDATLLLSLAPGLVQAVFAAIGDLYTFKLARKVLPHDDEAAWTTLLANLLSLYTLHTATRTLSNSLEATLTVVALYYFPLRDTGSTASSLRISLVLFALAAALRPSNVALSLPLVVVLLARLVRSGSHSRVADLVASSLAAALLVSIALLIADSAFYGRPTFTPLAFLRRNVLEGISLFYGASPFHFYLTSGLPLVCFTTLPWTLLGFWQALNGGGSSSGSPTKNNESLATLARVTLLFVAGMSLLGHKEQRFLQPVVPLLHLFEGLALYQSDEPHPRREEKKKKNSNDHDAKTPPPQRLLRSLARLRRRQPWAYAALLAHLIPAAYLFAHGSGTTRVMEHLSRRDDVTAAAAHGQLGVLMPCHSTPWQSHLHAPHLSAWFITCEPPLAGQDLVTYEDESDVFYKDPSAFLVADDQRIQATSHLVVFESLLDDDRVHRQLSEQGFVVHKTFWNSLWHPDSRRRGRVLLLQRKDWTGST